jgi:hypothetical protein
MTLPPGLELCVWLFNMQNPTLHVTIKAKDTFIFPKPPTPTMFLATMTEKANVDDVRAYRVALRGKLSIDPSDLYDDLTRCADDCFLVPDRHVCAVM